MNHARTFSREFVVAGTGPFPFDMLRFDECWPVRTEDAAAVGLDCSNTLARDTRRCVTLATHRPYGGTIGRWESFGWKVISHDSVTGAPVHRDDLAATIVEFKAGGRAAL